MYIRKSLFISKLALVLVVGYLFFKVAKEERRKICSHFFRLNLVFIDTIILLDTGRPARTCSRRGD